MGPQYSCLYKVVVVVCAYATKLLFTHESGRFITVPTPWYFADPSCELRV